MEATKNRYGLLTAVVKNQQLARCWLDLEPQVHQVRFATFLGLVEVDKCSDDAVAAVLHFPITVDRVMLVCVVMVGVKLADLCFPSLQA